MCGLFKQKSCAISTRSNVVLRNSSDLNKFLASSINDQMIVKLVEKFENKSASRLRIACSNVYRDVYCDAIDLIAKWSRNRTEYLARKINFLLTNVRKIMISN